LALLEANAVFALGVAACVAAAVAVLWLNAVSARAEATMKNAIFHRICM
jgi:hypothetical protein